jgi:HEAT repeat protein
VSIPFQLALAATGDADALRTIVGYAASKRFSLRHPYDRDRMLELPGLGEAVEEAFKTNSGWLEGAEWLALHGNRAGATLLRDHLKTQVGREQASVARALLRLNDPDAREALLAYYERHDPWETPLGGSAEERAFARTLDEAGASRLRDAVVYPSSLRAPLRLLAHRADPTALAFFRSQIRSTTYQTDDLALGLALAGAGATSLRPDFLRMIRSTNASRRIAGAHSLAALGDRNAVLDLVPLLDDLQSDPVVRRAEGIRRGFSSVSEAAAGAIERLAGREFPGSRANRIEAIRAWSQAEFPKR